MTGNVIGVSPIMEMIQQKLGEAAKGWTPKQAQIETVRQDLARVESQVKELQTQLAKTPVQKGFESRGN